jgi:ATP-dependent DNA helicase 2 subunit 2
LTNLKTEGGKVVKEHPLLPTKEQSTLMDELVQEMDLDVYAAKQVSEDDEDEEDEKKLVMDRYDNSC